MSIKNLAFPQLDIDNRLYKAHIHDNMSALDQISIDLLNKLNDAAMKDLSNITDEILTARIDNLKTYVKDITDASTDLSYVRKRDRWVKLKDELIRPTLTSTTLDVVDFSSAASDIPFHAIVELTADQQDTLKSVANKIDKLPGVSNNMLLISKDQSAAASNIEASTVLTKNSVYNGYADNPDEPLGEEAKTTPVSAAAVFLLAQSMGLVEGTEASLNFASFRGIVDCLDRNTTLYTVGSLSSMSAFNGVASVGQLFYTTNNVSPCVIQVNSVNSDTNAPKTIELLDGGSWIKQVDSLELVSANGCKMTIKPSTWNAKANPSTLPALDSSNTEFKGSVGDTMLVGYDSNGQKSLWRITKNSSNEKVWSYVYGLASSSSSSSNINITDVSNFSNSYLYNDPTLTPTDPELFSYTVLDDGSVSITGFKDISAGNIPEKIVLPAIINGKVVSKLADDAFATMEAIKEVYFSNTITHAGRSVFSGCSNLTYLDLGKCSYVDSFFATNCDNLASVRLSDNLSQLSIDMFSNTKIQSSGVFVVPATVTSMDNTALANCSGIRRVVFLNSRLTVDDSESQINSGDVEASSITVVCEKGSTVDTWAKKHKYSVSYNIIDAVSAGGGTPIYQWKKEE